MNEPSQFEINPILGIAIIWGLFILGLALIGI